MVLVSITLINASTTLYILAAVLQTVKSRQMVGRWRREGHSLLAGTWAEKMERGKKRGQKSRRRWKAVHQAREKRFHVTNVFDPFFWV